MARINFRLNLRETVRDKAEKKIREISAIRSQKQKNNSKINQK